MWGLRSSLASVWSPCEQPRTRGPSTPLSPSGHHVGKVYDTWQVRSLPRMETEGLFQTGLLGGQKKIREGSPLSLRLAGLHLMLPRDHVYQEDSGRQCRPPDGWITDPVGAVSVQCASIYREPLGPVAHQAALRPEPLRGGLFPVSMSLGSSLPCSSPFTLTPRSFSC